MDPTEFERMLIKATEEIDVKTRLNKALLGKLGVHPFRAQELCDALTSNKTVVWQQYLDRLRSEEDAIKYDKDEVEGREIWNEEQVCRFKRGALDELRREVDKRSKLQKVVTTALPKASMSSFLSRLPEAKFVENSKVIELSERTPHSGDSIIFIRDCFLSLYEIVKNEVLKGEHISLTGTPGLGKSMFAYYVAPRLLREQNVAVIFIHMGWSETHLFLPEVVPARVQAVLAKYQLENRKGGWVGKLIGTSSGLDVSAHKLYSDLACLKGDVVVILDPPEVFDADVFEPPSTGLFILTDPRHPRSTAADMHGGLRRAFFPLWTLDEVHCLLKERLQRELTPTESVELEMRFWYFGGVPRWIAKPDVSHDKMMLLGLQYMTKGLAYVKIDTLVDMYGNHSNGLLIHMKVASEEFFKLPKKKFASAMVEAELYRQFYSTRRLQLQQFLSAVREIEGFKQGAGTLLHVPIWHAILQSGGAQVDLEELLPQKGVGGTFPRNKNRRKVQLPSTASRYSARQKLEDVTNLRPSSDELGTYLHFLAPNETSAVDALSVIPMSTAETIFGVTSKTAVSESGTLEESHTAESMSSSTKKEWCMIAYQLALSDKDELNTEEGITVVMNLSERACGPSPALVHFVFVTTPSRAGQCHFVNVEAEPRFKNVRQWLLTVPDDVFSVFTRD